MTPCRARDRYRRLARPLFLVNPASSNGSTGRRWPELAHRATELGLDGDDAALGAPRSPDRARRGSGARGRAARRRRRRRDAQRGRERRLGGRDGGGRDDPTRHRAGLRPHARHPEPLRRRGAGRRSTARHGRSTSGVCTDVGRRTRSRYFANVGTVGMSGAVAQRANAMTKALGGKATFFYALTVEFLAWRNTQVRSSSTAACAARSAARRDRRQRPLPRRRDEARAGRASRTTASSTSS